MLLEIGGRNCKILEQWQAYQQLYAEPGLHCAHKCRQQRMADLVNRAQAHNLEQQETNETNTIILGQSTPGSLQCLLSVHVGDVEGTAPKSIAESLLNHLNANVGACKAYYGSFLRIGIHREHSPCVVFTHQYVYVDSIQPMKLDLYSGKDDEALCGKACREAYRSILGVVAWTVLTRVELAVYVQGLQRRAHAPMVTDCKRLDLVIRYMKTYNCGLKFVCLKRP